MIYLNDVCDYVEQLKPTFNHYYAGFLDKKKEKSLGVYNLKREVRTMALGGNGNSSYAVKRISLLVHWNNSTDESEKIADSLYSSIVKDTPEKIGNHKIFYIIMLNDNAIDISRDENGVCEYVIEFEIYYEREES